MTELHNVQAQARSLCNAVDRFRYGCANTAPFGAHPADCRECAEVFVNHVRRVLAEGLAIPPAPPGVPLHD